MTWRKLLRKNRQKVMMVMAVLMSLMMLVPAWLRFSSGGGSTVTLSMSDIKKYMFVPNPKEVTVMLFVASPKECPACPQVTSNVTQAVQVLKKMLEAQHLNLTFKVFVCQGFPQCKNKEAYVNFLVYRVDRVPLLLISYDGLTAAVNPVGKSPKQLAAELAAWVEVLKHVWRPPKTGKYLVYFYDLNHTTPFYKTMLALASQYGFKVIEMGCKSYPNVCNNITAYSTMIYLGLRADNLPFVLVVKDGRVVAGGPLVTPSDLQKLEDILKKVS